ncbi:MAG: hypothetical protein KDD40_10050, partial [Bdellovibrionales bacterium]|nr:hypothetical protein [Bdellovibrionales bacterium]
MSNSKQLSTFLKKRIILHALGCIAAVSSVLSIAVIYITYVLYIDENSKFKKDLYQVLDFILFYFLLNFVSLFLTFTFTILGSL